MASNKDAPVLFALPAPRSVGKGLLCLCRKVFWQNGGVVHFVYAPVCKNDAVELLKDPSAVKLLKNPNDDLLTIAPNGAIIGVQQTVRTTLPTPHSKISPISPSICASEISACVAKQAVAKSHVPIKPRLSLPKVTPLSRIGEQVETVTLSLTPNAPSEAEHAPSTSPDLPQSSKTQDCQQILQSTSSNGLTDVVIGSDSNMTNECKDSNLNMPKISAVFSLAKTYIPPAKTSRSPADSIEDTCIIEPLDLSVKKSSLDDSKNHQNPDKQYSETDSVAINLTIRNNLHSRSRAPKAIAAVPNSPMETVATLDTLMETDSTLNTPIASIALPTTPSTTVAALNSPTATIAAPNKQMKTYALQNTTIANSAMSNQPTANCNSPTATVAIQRESKPSIQKLTLVKESTPKKHLKRKQCEESGHRGTKKQGISSTATITALHKQTETGVFQNTTIANVAMSNMPTANFNSPTATESKPSIKKLTLVKESTPKKCQKRKLSELSGYKGSKKQRISIINGNNPLKLKFAWKKTPKKSDVYNRQSKDKSLNGVTLKSIVKKDNINTIKSNGQIPDINKTVIEDECMKHLESNSEEQGKYKTEEDVHLTSFSGTDVVIVNGRNIGHKFKQCSGIISINGRIPCVKLNHCNNTLVENETKRDCSQRADICSPSKSKGKPRGRPPKINNTNKTINDDVTENECSKMEDLSSPSKSKVKPRGRPPKMHDSNNTSSEIERKNNTITYEETKKQCSQKEDLPGPSIFKVKSRGRPPKIHNDNNTISDDETKKEFSQKDDLPGPSQSKVKSRGRPPKSHNSNNTSSEIERKKEYSQNDDTTTDSDTQRDCVQKDILPASAKSKVTTKGRPKSRSVSHKPKPSIAFQSVPSIESFTRHPDFHRIPTNNKVEYLKELLKAQRAAMGIY